MRNIGDNGMGNQQFEIEIPDGAEYVIFNNGSDQTCDTPLGHTGYYTTGERVDGKLVATGWD